MNAIEELKSDHPRLRRLAREIEAAVGEQRGVGWDDRASCDVRRLLAVERDLARQMTEHERRERRALADAARAGLRCRELLRELERSERELGQLEGLLRTVASLCDGSHVHAVRTAVGRLVEELEARLAYEEQVLFPALDGRPRPPSAPSRG